MKMICPHCGNDSFKAIMQVPAQISVDKDENGKLVYNLIAKDDTKTVYEIVGCTQCNEKFNEDALIEGTQCKECGKFAPVNEEGLCVLCEAKKTQPDLFKMTKEELMIKLLNLEKQKSVTAFANTHKGIAEAAEKASEQPVQNTAVEEPKKKKVKKKAVEQPAEQPVEQEETQEEPTVEEAPVEQTEDPIAEGANQMTAFLDDLMGNNIGQSQLQGENAPFPNVNNNSSSNGEVGTLGQTSFALFQSDEDARF